MTQDTIITGVGNFVGIVLLFSFLLVLTIGIRDIVDPSAKDDPKHKPNSPVSIVIVVYILMTITFTVLGIVLKDGFVCGLAAIAIGFGLLIGLQPEEKTKSKD